MKKYFAAACMAMAVIACNKDINLDETCRSENNSTVARTMTLEASLPGTRVEVDLDNKGKVTWSADDVIAVYNTDGDKFAFTVKDGAGTDKATFKCDEFTGEIGDIAVYPYDLAGAVPGVITIPQYTELNDNIPAVMASKIETGDSEEVSPLYFNSLMAILEFTLKDVPAYARGFKLYNADSDSKAGLRGDYTVNDERTALETLPPNGTQTIYFPYKTAYGSDASVTVRVAVPAYEYSKLQIRIVDGDETVIEGTPKTIPARNFSGISANAYIRMPELNIRSMVGTARDNYVKVEGVKWAKGNLRAWQGGTTGEGWQEGWNIYNEQWQSQYALLNDSVTGERVNFGLNETKYKTDSDITHFDYFSWGTLGRASRVHNQVLISKTEGFDITGKVFSISSKLSATGTDISDMTLLTGDDRFAANGFSDGNPSIVGDLAFWASKGQYRLPKGSEMETLNAKENIGKKSSHAHMQAGYYMAGDKKINGILFTSCPSWETTTYNTTAIELDDADLESGLFLPKIGERTTNKNPNTYDHYSINYFNVWGVYWSGTYGSLDSGYEDCAYHINFTSGNVMTYGYKSKLSNTISGQTKLGNAIRPVLVD